MSEVTLRWTQRCAGRDIGDVATVERTPFMDALINTGRVTVLEEASPIPAIEPIEVVSEEPVARPVRMKPSMLAALNNPEVTDGGTGPVS